MYRRFIIWVRNYLGFSKTETNGYLALLVLLGVIHFGTRYYIALQKPEAPLVLDSLPGPSQDTSHKQHTNPQITVQSLPAVDSVSRIQRPEKTVATKSRMDKKRQSEKAMDLNLVDSLWLKQVYGIGPILSQRIVKYRDLLGGFYSVGQLKEVYHLPPEVIETLQTKVFIDIEQTPLHKIDINVLDYTQIAAHPYLSFQQARAIVSFRKHHGLFNRLEDLKKIHLIDDSTYLRVRPYLDF